MLKITIDKHAFKEMVNHAISEHPFEGCGLLVGIKQHITTFLPLVNEALSHHQFKVSQNQIEHLLNDMTFTNQEIMAIYHSHPLQRAIPSSLDLLNHPDDSIKMIIVSLKQDLPEVKCYSINNHNYVECKLIIDEQKE